MKLTRLAAFSLSFFVGRAALAEGPTVPPPAPPVVIAPTGPVKKLDLGTYLGDVGRGNWEIAAARAGATAAQAQIAVAKVFPDPFVTAGLQQVDITRQPNPTATVLSLTLPLQVGGQRSARINVAEAGAVAALADVEDTLRLLRAQAANAYVDALHARLILDRKKRTQASLERLVGVNEVRLKAGDVAETSFIQSRVEAQQFAAQVIAGEGDVRVADLALLVLLGRTMPSPAPTLELGGDLAAASRKSFVVDALVKDAIAHRPDLRASQSRLEQTRRQISLARANRIPDITLSAYWQHNFPFNGVVPFPSSDFLGTTVAVPLPFSRVYRGELDAAYAGEIQSDAMTRALIQRVEIEVRQALIQYDAGAGRVKVYVDGGVLADADSVLDRSFYNYQRGGASFVEVLVAQRTVNDVYLSYYGAITDAAHALVALEQAVASTDIPF
ncbi:TolC family protein [soil metagenome]